jgi:hypothetical protein
LVTKRLRAGTDVMIFKIFSPKNLAKIGVFDSKQKIMQKFYHNIVFEKNAIFSPKNGKNRRKL